MDQVSLEDQLVEQGFKSLFLQGDKDKLEKIWANGANQEEIRSIISAKESSWQGRFLASEVLLHYELVPRPENYSMLAEAYASALEQTSTVHKNKAGLNGNLWGFLYPMDDPGFLGRRFILFGKDAIPSLKLLLKNDASGILYEGSKEAMVGNGYQYRIKDFATFYLSKITNIPVQFFQEISQRDIEIARFTLLINSL